MTRKAITPRKKKRIERRRTRKRESKIFMSTMSDIRSAFNEACKTVFGDDPNIIAAELARIGAKIKDYYKPN